MLAHAGSVEIGQQTKAYVEHVMATLERIQIAKNQSAGAGPSRYNHVAMSRALISCIFEVISRLANGGRAAITNLTTITAYSRHLRTLKRFW